MKRLQMIKCIYIETFSISILCYIGILVLMILTMLAGWVLKRRSRQQEQEPTRLGMDFELVDMTARDDAESPL